VPSYPLNLVEASPALLKDADVIDAHNVSNEDDYECEQLWGAYSLATCVAPNAPPHELRVVTIKLESMDELDRARAVVELAKGGPEITI
jgi:hypothetical protein